MESTGCKFIVLLSFLFCLGLDVMPVARAHIAVMDDVWTKRAEEAEVTALEAYNPFPDELTQETNIEVHQALDRNSTRRHLGHRYKGRCLATNPIDRCWRCQPGWAKNRKKLAQCVLGFGRKTMGGKYGKIYVVTDSSDNDMLNPRPGTLRYGVIQDEPLWIIFARDMIIRLNQELMINSYKTIDARGAHVHIAYGAGITIQFVQHVIIHNLHIHDIVVTNGGMIRDSTNHYGLRTASDGDGVSVFGSVNVWLDHLSMYRCKDGLIDVIEGSTAITISNNHLTKHNDVMLMGASDAYSKDAIMQVTIAFNHFGKGLIQRMPRCRWGFFHVLNNDYTHWIMYAVGGSKHPTIISQGNRYIAPPDLAAKEVTKRDYASESEWKQWTWRSEGDLLMNGAFFRQSGALRNSRHFSSQDFIKAKPGSYAPRLTRFAGTIVCKVGCPC
ncbi:pectate lyase-like [Aristolochia californica]|uniref:pectate lyase-like n=1 Tax=Aristolochia californica TaxID=171875 RepID=UPI0035DDCBB7